MTILQINNNHYLKGGTESVYLNTIELLSQKGHKVVSLALTDEKSIKSAQNHFSIERRALTHNRFFSLSSIKKIKEVLKNEKPDVVHIHNIIGGITYSILPYIKRMGIPIVASIHDFRLLCPVYVFINGKKEICERCKTGKYYNCIINNCSPEGYPRSIILSAESYLRDLFIPYNKIINQFIFVSRFTKNKFLEFNPHLENISNHLYNFTNDFKLNINRGDYFLYFGRLSREKGLRTLVQAFSKLPDIKLKIVGDGDLRVELERIKLPNIELLGYKSGDELKDIIRNSSFVIVPSECYENNPLAVVESFALAKPVIGSQLGGIIELIDNVDTGYLFIGNNSESLMKIILKANSMTKNEYSNMAQNAYDFAVKKFSSEKYYSNLINIYDLVIRAKNYV
jgi:glycosyltransferase involved in cell wall biosynthesis